MSKQDVGAKRQAVHVLGCRSKDLPRFHQCGTAGLCFTGSLEKDGTVTQTQNGGGKGTSGRVCRASDGTGGGRTSMYGTPMSFSSFLHSSLCWLVTFTRRFVNFSMFSCSPARQHSRAASEALSNKLSRHIPRLRVAVTCFLRLGQKFLCLCPPLSSLCQLRKGHRDTVIRASYAQHGVSLRCIPHGWRITPRKYRTGQTSSAAKRK